MVETIEEVRLWRAANIDSMNESVKALAFTIYTNKILARFESTPQKKLGIITYPFCGRYDKYGYKERLRNHVASTRGLKLRK